MIFRKKSPFLEVVGDVPCKVKVTGTVQRVDRNYVVEGEIAAVLSLNCDKCLSAFEAQLDLNMNEVFSEDVDSEKEFLGNFR